MDKNDTIYTVFCYLEEKNCMNLRTLLFLKLFLVISCIFFVKNKTFILSVEFMYMLRYSLHLLIHFVLIYFLKRFHYFMFHKFCAGSAAVLRTIILSFWSLILRLEVRFEINLCSLIVFRYLTSVIYFYTIEAKRLIRFIH